MELATYKIKMIAFEGSTPSDERLFYIIKYLNINDHTNMFENNSHIDVFVRI